MTNEYIVSLIREHGTVKTVIVDAMDCKDAELIVSNKYPGCEVIRVATEQAEIDYINKVRDMRMQGNSDRNDL